MRIVFPVLAAAVLALAPLPLRADEAAAPGSATGERRPHRHKKIDAGGSQATDTVEEKKPAVEEKKPAAEEEKPAAEEEKPAVEEKKPAVEEKKPAAEEKKPAVEEKKPAVEEKKPAVEEKKPAVEEKPPSGVEAKAEARHRRHRRAAQEETGAPK